MKDILSTIEGGTGQQVSEEKCSVLFANGVSEENKVAVQGTLCVQHEAFETKYLGLPTPEGRISKNFFKSLGDRLCQKTSDWSEKLMSCAAKEVLIKSVALPCHTVWVFSSFLQDCVMISQVKYADIGGEQRK